MINNWEKPEVSSQYIESISQNPENEINVTKKYYHDPFFYSEVPDLNNKTALDVGCGDGYMVKALAEKYPQAILFGSDLPNMIEQAQNNNLPSNISLVEASCYDLPFEDGALDFVFSSLLAHWVEDFEKMVEEMFRVLKPGGDLLISFIHPYTFHVGKWENLDTDEPNYVITKDISIPQTKDVYINETVGPVTYYMRPLDYFPEVFKKIGFKNLDIKEPVVSDTEILKIQPGLKKYKKHPLYLIIEAKK